MRIFTKTVRIHAAAVRNSAAIVRIGAAIVRNSAAVHRKTFCNLYPVTGNGRNRNYTLFLLAVLAALGLLRGAMKPRLSLQLFRI